MSTRRKQLLVSVPSETMTRIERAIDERIGGTPRALMTIAAAMRIALLSAKSGRIEITETADDGAERKISVDLDADERDALAERYASRAAFAMGQQLAKESAKP